MGRLLALIGLFLVLAAPVHAGPLQRKAALSPNVCSDAYLKTDFTANGGQGVYCLKGQRFGSFLAIPGATFTRASAETCEWLSGLLTSAVSGQPCVTDKGLGVWESRTNLSTFSIDTTNAVWVAGAGTATTGQPDPFGGAGAALFTADGTSANHIYRNTGGFAISFTSASTYTLSYFVKPGTATRVQLTGNGTPFGTMQYANFLLTGPGSVTGSTGLAGAGAVVNAYANGWYRIAITVTATATGTGDGGLLLPLVTGSETRAPTNTSTGTFTAMGSQPELGAFMTPLIITTSASATRAADVVFIAGVATPASAYAMYIRALYPPTWVNGAIFAEGATAVAGALKGATIETSTSPGNVRLVQRSGAARGDTDGNGPTITLGAPFSAGLSTDGISALFSMSGVTVASGSTPGEIDWSGGIAIGSRTGNATWINTYIQRLLIYASPDSQAVMNGRTSQ